jgi:ligand-binding sensor protein
MYQGNLPLRDLVSLEDWQKEQDAFSEVLGTTLRTVDLNGELLTKVSKPTRLCNETFVNCILKRKTKERLGIKKVTNLKCPFGLDLYVVPIEGPAHRVESYIILGPLLLNKRKDKREYERAAKKAGIELADLMDMLIEVNVFSYSKVRSIIGLLQSVFSYMTKTGHHKKRLGEIAPEVVEIDSLFSTYYEEKVLNTLLNVCTLAFNADSGSVMVVDANTGNLRIKVASRLGEEVINHSQVRMGEGIAGLAAATAEPIILPKDSAKSGLSRKMKRKYIRSSMIVPFSKINHHDVYGVINLNMMRKRKQFSTKDIAFAKELTSLASVALLPAK